MNFSLIIPLRDEEESVDRIEKEVPIALDKIEVIKEYEIVCVDDGSTDSTLQKLKKIASENKNFKIISLKKGVGQTGALVAGIETAKYDTIGIIDADLQTNPNDFALLIKELKKGYDCVSGKRVERNDNLNKRFSTWIARKTTQLIIKNPFHDITCPLKVLEKKCVEGLTFYDTFHRYIPYLVQMRGYKVSEIPVSHHPRIAGKSHYGALNRLWVGIKSMFVVKWMKNNQIEYKIK